jgi:Polyketide cyclase / dehydrase and lipid transport
VGDDVVEEFQVVVAGNAEDLGDAELGETVQQVVADGVDGIGRGISHEDDGTLGANLSRPDADWPIVRAMAIKESREIVIEASPGEILDVIADVEAMPEWSGPHQSAAIVETGDDGRPSQVKMKVKVAGITDEQVVAYTWSGNEVSWTLVSSAQQKSQDGKYILVPKGDDKTLVKFEVTVDPNVPLPGFVLKRAVKGTMDAATQELRKRVLQVKGK